MYLLHLSIKITNLYHELLKNRANTAVQLVTIIGQPNDVQLANTGLNDVNVACLSISANSSAYVLGSLPTSDPTSSTCADRCSKMCLTTPNRDP